MTGLRSWAPPLIIGGFLLMGVSGTLTFFHIETTPMKVVHEWASWLMLAGAIAQCVLNRPASSADFKRPFAMEIMGVSAVVLALTFLPIGPSQNTGDITRIAMGALSGGQIETLAELAESDTETVLAQLGTAGVEASATDTPQPLSQGGRMVQMQIIITIFAS